MTSNADRIKRCKFFNKIELHVLPTLRCPSPNCASHSNPFPLVHVSLSRDYSIRKKKFTNKWKSHKLKDKKRIKILHFIYIPSTIPKERGFPTGFNPIIFLFFLSTVLSLEHSAFFVLPKGPSLSRWILASDSAEKPI